MIRQLVGLTIGAGIMLAFLAAILWSQPVRAAECLIASWYGTESGNRTANGEHFDGRSFTAAHRTLPFGTKLRVTYRSKSVVVRINDRGPFIKGRGLDLSHAAARKIGLTKVGVGKVCISRL